MRRLIRAVCALVVLSAGLLVLAPATPAAATTLADMIGRPGVISSTEHKFVLDVEAAGRGDWTRVMAWPFHGFANQNWKLRSPFNDGWFTLTAEHSGKCLDVKNGSVAAGAVVQQYTCHNGGPQLWQVTFVPSINAFQLMNRSSGMCLTMPAVQQAQVTQQLCSEPGRSQHFQWSTPLVALGPARVVAVSTGPVASVSRLVPGSADQYIDVQLTPSRDAAGNPGFRILADERRLCLRADPQSVSVDKAVLLQACDPVAIVGVPADQLFRAEHVGFDGVAGRPFYQLRSFLAPGRCLTPWGGTLLLSTCQNVPNQHFAWS